MPVNGYSVGRDVTVTISGPGGTTIVIPASAVTAFDKRPGKREDYSRPLNSPPIPLYMPDGWRGTFSVDRQDPTLDTFQASQEANFWAGQNTLSGTILESITETNGSTSQYRYDDVMYWVDEPGAASADRKISQRVEWTAGRRTRVA
jgi:hypothetical protein